MRCHCCHQRLPASHLSRNAFKPWTKRLDNQLLFQADCYRRMGLEVELAAQRMADFFGRSVNSILCRLRKFDLITE